MIMILISKALRYSTCYRAITQFRLSSTRLIQKWNEPLLPSRRASPHFGRYLFPIPMTIGGWMTGYIPRW